MIFGNGSTSKGKILKARNFHKSYVILTPFQEVYPKLFFVLWSFAKFFPCRYFWEISPLLLLLPFEGIKQKKKLDCLKARKLEKCVGWNTSQIGVNQV